jgi:hypothetical protein
MKTYTYSEARQHLATVLDLARREGRVQIRRQDGSVFMVQPISSEGSPLDVPGVGTTLRPGELTRLLREQRKASGERLIKALSSRRALVTKARYARRTAGTRKK